MTSPFAITLSVNGDDLILRPVPGQSTFGQTGRDGAMAGAQSVRDESGEPGFHEFDFHAIRAQRLPFRAGRTGDLSILRLMHSSVCHEDELG